MMEQLFSVSGLLNVLVLVVGWSIKSELHHISQSIEEARESASEAHRRIDAILAKGS